MRYYRALIFFFILGIINIILLLYFANNTRKIEKENYQLSIKINNIKDQININEIEYSLYNSYEYLNKLRRVYFEDSINEDFNNRISFSQLKNNSEKILKVGIK